VAPAVSELTRPAVVAALLAAGALLLHPAARTGAWLPQRDAVLAALLLLTTIALVLRAIGVPRRLGAALLAAGGILVLGAVGADGVRGYRGTLALEPGQARSHFDEIGPEGRSLGLRPLGFTVGLERSLPAGALALVLPEEAEAVVLTPERAVSAGGFRFSRPRVVPTGEPARLRVGISGGGEDATVDIAPGRPARAGDLTIAVEDYFPDFALDEQRRPFSRSREPRNPGAVLAVESPRGPFRVFVLRSMPGVHRVESLDRSFALLAVDPGVAGEIEVRREPFGAAALLGVLLALAGVVLGRRHP
jgi:hypothetical protein